MDDTLEKFCKFYKMDDTLEMFCKFFDNLYVMKPTLNFLNEFNVPLSVSISFYQEAMTTKMESWQDCNLGYLRNKLNEHFEKYGLDKSKTSQIRVEELAHIINYSLMLMIREKDLMITRRIDERRKEFRKQRGLVRG